jgi:hypothetical protein
VPAQLLSLEPDGPVLHDGDRRNVRFFGENIHQETLAIRRDGVLLFRCIGANKAVRKSGIG